jgi:proteasome component ECM29
MLQPHVGQLIAVMLESLSSLEPAQFNYLSFHTDKINISQEQLEEARDVITKFNPITESLDLCVKYVDSSNSEEVTRRLIEILKTGVGMPTKTGAARFISSLTYSKSEEMAPHASKLLVALANTLKDRSPAARKGFANAAANVAKLAPITSVGKYIEKLIVFYNEQEVTLFVIVVYVLSAIFLE